MVVAEKIQQYVQKLPAPFQSEVLDFVQYLLAKAEQETGSREEKAWSALSLSPMLCAIWKKRITQFTPFQI